MGCCTWDVGESENPDIRGYLLNNVGRGLLFISQLFLFNAMLSFANDAAGCTTGGTGCEDDDDDDTLAFVNGTAIFSDDDDDDACGRILGLKPVTLVVQVMALGSLVSATFMPVVGSVVDHSPHRRRLGIAGLVVAWLCSLAQTGIAPASWLFLLLLQGSVASAAYLTNVVCAMAYMPELTDDLDGHMQRINAKARVLELASMLVFMSLVATVEGSDSVGVRDTARFAQALSCLVGGPIALASWRYLTPRPTAHAVPEGASLLTAGFLKVRETAAMLAADFPQLYRFLLAFAVMEAGTSSIIGLVVVYVSQQLCLEVGPVLTLAILFTIPGALLSRKLAAGGRAKEALFGNCLSFAVLIAAIPACLYDASHAPLVPLFSATLGLAVGFMYPAQRNVVAVLIPGGLEGRVMGIYQFASISLGWAPPLIFGLVYEATGSMRMAIVTPAFFHGAAAVFLQWGVDMTKGGDRVTATLHKRRRSTSGGDLVGKNRAQVEPVLSDKEAT